MLIRKATPDTDKIWYIISKVLEFSDLTWPDVSRRLKDTKLTSTALQARATRKNKSRDWRLIVEVLSVLKCNAFIIIPEEDEGEEVASLFEQHIEQLKEYAHLDPEDRKLVRAFTHRLNQKPARRL